jgi:hypothetical protein
MATLIHQLALVSETPQAGFSDVSTASAAIQKQIARDFSPLWGVQATIDAFATLQDVPLGYWPVIIRDDIPFPNALGIHLDDNNQPYALVSFNPNWQMTASHEALEMLGDPSGNRLIAGDSPDSSQGRVEFLVEVCDPSEGEAFGYTVNGVLLSDFYTPAYFDPVAAPGVRYSFTGAITEPRQVLSGGYLSWHDPVSDNWFQLQFFGAAQQIVPLGKLNQSAGSLRSQVDRITNPEALKARSPQADASRAVAGASRAAVAVSFQAVSHASQARAKSLHAAIETVKSRATEDAGGPAAAASPMRRPPRRGR